MRVWIDLANSPHVPLFEPVVDALRRRGDTVLLTARDHAQTLPLARRAWPDVHCVGGASPPGRLAKGSSVFRRARGLAAFAAAERVDVALSHGSYAQLVAARAIGIPGVTMMDYEHQPANHLSFRLARRVLVPDAFPEQSLRRFGARRKAVRYDGFKEDVYLAAREPDRRILAELGIDEEKVIVVMRPPPEGSLYHRHENLQFDALLDAARAQPHAAVVLLPRTEEQRERYSRVPGVVVPGAALDGASLLAAADLMIGGGGTMNREAALLGTPAYTVFSGRLAAVDARLIAAGLLIDLRGVEELPPLRKRGAPAEPDAARRDAILAAIFAAVDAVAAGAARAGVRRRLARLVLRPSDRLSS